MRQWRTRSGVQLATDPGVEGRPGRKGGMTSHGRGRRVMAYVHAERRERALDGADRRVVVVKIERRAPRPRRHRTPPSDAPAWRRRRGDHRHAHRRSNRAGQLQIIAARVPSDPAGQQDLAGAASGARARPLEGVDAGALAPPLTRTSNPPSWRAASIASTVHWRPKRSATSLRSAGGARRRC